MKKPPAKRPPAQQNESRQQVEIRHTTTTAAWSGPLPPPSALAQFNEVVENGAERIVRAWEEETEHRRTIEKSDQRLFYRDVSSGKILAFLVVLAAFGLSAYAATIGAEWVAVVVSGGTIASLVLAFVTAQKRT